MNIGRVVIGVGCTYELAALPDRSPLPTITQIVARGRRSNMAAKLAVMLWCGVWSYHFLADD